MLRFGLLLVIIRIGACHDYGPASNQLPIYRDSINETPTLTTSSGCPVGFNESRVTLNKPLIFHEYFMDTISHLDRERIPERAVHAKGAGAFGEFIVTNDITNICKAKFLNYVGKKTPVAVRFSLVAANTGSIDTQRDTRGFAIKFYTEEGNFDIPGLNIPVFPIKDPIFFPTFVHSQKRNPVTNLQDKNMFWDFFTIRPESMHAAMFLLGDNGIPFSYRQMPGFGIHTYEVVNDCGEYSFIRFHFEPNAGIDYMDSSDAKLQAGEDPDFHTRDLYDAIANGDYPSWNISAQILSLDEVKTAKFDVFDTTKSLPIEDYPLTPIGRLVLNRNANNFFADIEQIAFCPGNLVPGILGSPDKLFEARRFSYRDTQFHRLGANFKKIAVNCPLFAANTYIRDGHPPVLDNGGSGPNYYPNSFNGPMPLEYELNPPLMVFHQTDTNNYEQASLLYKSMPEEERKRLINNVIDSLKSVDSAIEAKVIAHFSHVDSDLGSRIANRSC